MYKNMDEPITLKNKFLVGSGAYGIIYKGERDDGTTVIVKKIKASREIDFMTSIREVDFLNDLKGHPLIVELIDVIDYNPFLEPFPEATTKNFRDDKYMMLMKEGTCDLNKKIHKQGIDYILCKKIMYQLAIAIEYIHHRNIVHRDIKPVNILWDEKDGMIKICDFGLAIRNYGQGYEDSRCQTSWYRAPEIACGVKRCDKTIDIWSLGCTFFEIVSRKIFFKPSDDKELIQYIFDFGDHDVWKKLFDRGNKFSIVNFKRGVSNIQSLNSHIGLSVEEKEKFTSAIPHDSRFVGTYSQFLDLLSGMLEIDPDKRFTIKDVLTSKFFQGFIDYGLVIRAKFCPCLPPPETLRIIKCRKRSYFINKIFSLSKHKDRNPIIDYFVFFHSIEIFDRILVYYSNETFISHSDNNLSISDVSTFRSQNLLTQRDRKNDDEINTILPDFYEDNLDYIVAVVVYICIKYYLEEHIAKHIPFTALLNLLDLKPCPYVEEIEFNIVKRILNFKIFRTTALEELVMRKNGQTKGASILMMLYYRLKSGTYLPVDIFRYLVKFHKMKLDTCEITYESIDNFLKHCCN